MEIDKDSTLLVSLKKKINNKEEEASGREADKIWNVKLLIDITIILFFKIFFLFKNILKYYFLKFIFNIILLK
jgi:hypothetical protein